MVRPNPVAAERRLRAELRRLREQAGKTQKQVAEALDWSASKIIRIETGAVGISTTDLKALLDLYAVHDQQQVDAMIKLARNSREHAWWDEYRSFPEYSSQFITFLGLEASASLLRRYQVLLIPGLLQTEAYARAIISAYTPDEESTERGVRIRMRRQELLDSADGPKAFFVVDESAIRRWAGDEAVWRAQLLRLKELNRRPNISIQVITFDQGVHLDLQFPFNILEFPEAGQDHVVFIDQPEGDVMLRNDPVETSGYLEKFYQLEAMARPSSELDMVIDRVLAEHFGGT